MFRCFFKINLHFLKANLHFFNFESNLYLFLKKIAPLQKMEF
jgi:hypothetical protein